MFTVTGQLDDGREVEVTWFPPGLERRRAVPTNRRGLIGDEALIEWAIRDELDGRSFSSTPTGPFFQADLDDPVATFVQLTSYFLPRYSLGGDPPGVPYDPVPEGAIP